MKGIYGIRLVLPFQGGDCRGAIFTQGVALGCLVMPFQGAACPGAIVTQGVALGCLVMPFQGQEDILSGGK